ncbi:MULTISPECIES: O-antigen ligase family protein [Methylobacterium]|uniref:O-antigen ligase family protein n=1 Tax=Methylobacterium TaxID=407 RepID=UPI00272E67B9|nr:O-antigen ligase family protein [Methylobacterium sp.]
MRRAASLLDRSTVLIPLLVGAGWAGSVALGPRLGPVVYAAPALAAVLAVLAIVLAGAAAARPAGVAILLVVVLAGLTIAFDQRQEGEVGLTPQNFLKLVVWLFLALVTLLQARRFLWLMRDPVLALTGLHVLVALVSAAWSLAPLYTLVNGIGLVGYLGLACLVAVRLPERTALRVTTGSLFALIGGGLVIGTLLPDLGWIPPSHGEPQWRFQGLSGQPNVYAQQAGYLLTLALCARRERHLSRGAVLACLVVAIVAILLSNSRTTLLACLLAWALVGLRERGRLRALAIPVGVAAALALLAGSLGGGTGLDGLFGGLTRSGSASELTTLTGRTEIWSVAADLIAQRPLLGWGYNGTEQLIADSVPTTFYGSHVNTHNMSVQLVLGLGFLGALPGLGFVAGLLWRLLRSPDPTRDQVTLLMVVSGLSEAPIFIMPALQNLVVFAVLARDAAWRVPHPTPRPPQEGAAP